jgi:hypothetical protein
MPQLPDRKFWTPSLEWLMETSSTDLAVLHAVVSLVPNINPRELHAASVVNIRVKDMFMSFFDDHDQCLPGAYDMAIACGHALAHLYWRRHFGPVDHSMLLPGESMESSGELVWRKTNQEWASFTRCWRHLESKDPNFLLVSQTGIARMEIGRSTDLDLSPYTDTFLASLLHSSSYTFYFQNAYQEDSDYISMEKLAIDILLRILHPSSFEHLGPSTSIVANGAWLVLCMLGRRSTRVEDVANNNKG